MRETTRTSEALRAVDEFRREIASTPAAAIDGVDVERRVQEITNALALELMSEVLALADMKDPEIRINGERWGNRRPTRGTYTTMFGDVTLERSTYQQAGRGRVAVPLDLQLGIVEGRYTPRTARVMMRATGLMPTVEAAEFLEEVGVAKVSVATLHRVPRAMAARYEIERLEIDRAVRDQDAIPGEAVTIQVGIDGAMVPQDGEHAKPRGRKTEEPDPPRHESRYGPSAATSTAANDDQTGRAWHEAGVGTIAFFDGEGERLKTLYFAQMPEPGKKTLAARVEEELQAVVRERPALTLCLASDGAPQHWDLLDAMRERLPAKAVGETWRLTDFFHVAEHLQKAADAIAGEGTPEARVISAQWKETLKELPDGTARVLKAMRYQRDHGNGVRRAPIASAIDYLAKQARHRRTEYASARARNLPIGTGVTEAAAKTVVSVRMKRAGARYSQHGGQTIMLFRTALLSKRFLPLSERLEETYTAKVRAA